MPPAAAGGERWERLAERHLRHHGLALVMRNYRCRLGEIDLLMRDGETLVVVEVRYRRSASHGGALASVTGAKRRKLALAARHYLGQHGSSRETVRFDVVAVSGSETSPRIDWRRAAFDAG